MIAVLRVGGRRDCRLDVGKIRPKTEYEAVENESRSTRVATGGCTVRGFDRSNESSVVQGSEKFGCNRVWPGKRSGCQFFGAALVKLISPEK